MLLSSSFQWKKKVIERFQLMLSAFEGKIIQGTCKVKLR